MDVFWTLDVDIVTLSSDETLPLIPMPDKMRHVCAANGYTDYREFENGRDACIVKLLYTHAILADLTWWGYGDRWCYHNYAAAKAALGAWEGEGEPTGWHRHPDSGRRRKGGDPAYEEICR